MTDKAMSTELRQDEVMNDETRARFAGDVRVLRQLVDVMSVYRVGMYTKAGGIYHLVSLVRAYAELLELSVAQDKCPESEANLVRVEPTRAEYVGEHVALAFGGFCLRSNAEARAAFLDALGLPGVKT